MFVTQERGREPFGADGRAIMSPPYVSHPMMDTQMAAANQLGMGGMMASPVALIGSVPPWYNRGNIQNLPYAQNIRQRTDSDHGYRDHRDHSRHDRGDRGHQRQKRWN